MADNPIAKLPLAGQLGIAIVIAVEGDVAVSAGAHGLVVPRGGVVLIPAALGGYDVAATNGPSTVFATSVPVPASS